MDNQNPYVPAQNLLSSSQKILVLLPPEPSEDQVIAALSLHLSLEHAKKESQIGCSSLTHVNDDITGLEKIRDSVGNRNLIISFDYKEEYLDKVDYDIRDNDKFCLVIKPKENAPVPDTSAVKFSYSGASADLVVVFGINSLEELGKIYSDEKHFLDSAKVVSLHLSPRPSAFTDIQLHLPLPSYSELVAILLEKSKLAPSADAATNLIKGIYQSTQNLSSRKLSADTFSCLAFLMRAGGSLPGQASFIGKLTPPPFFEPPLLAPQLNPAGLQDDTDNVGPVPTDWKKPKIFRLGENPS